MSFIRMSLLKTVVVLCAVVYTTADEDYENKLTKLWSLSGSSNSDGSAVLNVTSASIVIQPTNYEESRSRNSRQEYNKYAFKPRAIPLRREQAQVERSVYYTDDKLKPVLFSGNYYPIAKEKSENLTEPVYPRSGRSFHPKAIPLMRTEEFQKRSLDASEEPVIKRPEGFSEQSASRRSISYFFDGLDDAEEGETEGDEEIEAEDETEGKHRKKPIKKLKSGKLKKYALPLLLAYKMKYFALVPVMIGGLILLIGATGLAGFFFALFAAVMGLQKGGY